MGEKKIFIIGYEAANLLHLQRLAASRDYRFYPALHHAELRSAVLDMPTLVETAYARMRAVRGGPDAVLSYYDFPGTDLVPVLAQRFGLLAPSLSSVLKCEHKYWSRLEQKKIIPQHLPRFCAFAPEAGPRAFDELGIPPPFWVKPVKSYRGYLAYYIPDRHQFTWAARQLRDKVGQLAEPFNWLLRSNPLFPELVSMSETCLAESLLDGGQCTLEGYAAGDEIVIYGVVDSIRNSGGASVARYQYPSCLPKEVQSRMADATRRLVRHLGLQNTAFNAEFFYNATADQIYLLEINPRISQSHAPLFHLVDGISNHAVALAMALGEMPPAFVGKGAFRIAANFMVRVFDGGRVVAVPGPEQIGAVVREIPELELRLHAFAGQQLDQLNHQESYSFELANIFLGANDATELVEKYHYCLRQLAFAIQREPQWRVY